jgi:hypothetical protein
VFRHNNSPTLARSRLPGGQQRVPRDGEASTATSPPHHSLADDPPPPPPLPRTAPAPPPPPPPPPQPSPPPAAARSNWVQSSASSAAMKHRSTSGRLRRPSPTRKWSAARGEKNLPGSVMTLDCCTMASARGCQSNTNFGTPPAPLGFRLAMCLPSPTPPSPPWKRMKPQQPPRGGVQLNSFPYLAGGRAAREVRILRASGVRQKGRRHCPAMHAPWMRQPLALHDGEVASHDGGVARGDLRVVPQRNQRQHLAGRGVADAQVVFVPCRVRNRRRKSHDERAQARMPAADGRVGKSASQRGIFA